MSNPSYQQLVDYLDELYNKDCVEFQDYINIEFIAKMPIAKVKDLFELINNTKYVELLELVMMTDYF